jgi:FAD/FMN-containing dehydrogenase
MDVRPIRLDSASVTALRTHLRGPLLLPDDPRYDAGRRVWSAAIDRHPAAIVACADAEDVSWALRLAADAGVSATVRGGGHNTAGRSIRDSALLIDLSPLRGVTVDAARRRAFVEGGALWRDVDAATARHELATTGGLVSSTGVGGFTLGGGSGWLMRRAGLACDNLVSAEVTLPDGRTIRASEDEHADLYWCLRGGGGAPGVVTRFEFALEPRSTVTGAFVVHRLADASAVMRSFRDWAPSAPDDFCAVLVLTCAPPMPFLEPAWHGQPVLICAMCWAGDPAGAAAAFAWSRERDPLGSHEGVLPYVDWQRALDPGAPAGRHHYWKTATFRDLGDTTIARLADAAAALPTPFTEIHVQHLGGAVARVPADDTAFAQRDVPFFVNLLGCSMDGDAFGGARRWVQALHGALAPEAGAGMLPNFTGVDDSGAVADDARGRRLEAIDRRYDPAGLLASR